MSLGLLLIEFNDAIREGDGNRICRCWQFFLPVFKATKRKNYAIEAFVLQAQLRFLFTPRMAGQLKWSRTVNIHGMRGKNVPCDLHMEHLNRTCKCSIAGLGSNISDKAVVRIGKCLGPVSELVTAFDKENGVPDVHGKHPHKSDKKDREKIVEQLVNAKVFTKTPGRHHIHFKNHLANPCKKLVHSELITWMEGHMLKLL